MFAVECARARRGSVSIHARKLPKVRVGVGSHPPSAADPPRGGRLGRSPDASPELLERGQPTREGQRRTKGVGLRDAEGCPRRRTASTTTEARRSGPPAAAIMSVSRPRSISMSSAGRSSQNKRRPSFLNDKGEVRLVENGFDLTPLPLLVDEAPPEEEAVVVVPPRPRGQQRKMMKRRRRGPPSRPTTGIRERLRRRREGRRAARRDFVD